ncbi:MULTISPECIES: hypothetical protein [Pseudobacillus]|uniref:hypothetical protein n=1 Tax=Pseudobacillus TaxID=108525 RepID=UPI00387A0924
MPAIQRAKAWVKSETSQLSNENGMFIILLIILVIGVGALLSGALKGGFQNMMETFEGSSMTDTSSVTDPIGKTDKSWDY